MGVGVGVGVSGSAMPERCSRNAEEELTCRKQVKPEHGSRVGLIAKPPTRKLA